MITKKHVLTVRGLKKWYKKRVKTDAKFFKENKDVKALDNVDLVLNAGETIGVIGESGCGKSTLGKLLVMLEEPTEGEILINGVSSTEMYKENPLQFRREVQIIFQNPFDSFDPRNTIGYVLKSTLKLHSIGIDEAERTQIIIETLEKVGLKPATNFIERYPHELSGGQLQRISIIRAMLVQPAILIADEAVSMLDVSVRAEIIKLLKELVAASNTALVFISHDINTTSYISDNIAVMYLGKIVEYGNTDSIIRDAQHPYTKVLLSNTASIDLDNQKEAIHITGEAPNPIDNGPGCFFAPRCYMAQEICFQKYPEEKNLGNTHIAACHFAG